MPKKEDGFDSDKLVEAVKRTAPACAAHAMRALKGHTILPRNHPAAKLTRKMLGDSRRAQKKT